MIRVKSKQIFMTCKKSFGFTLIELLIVVAVGAILIVVALISLNGIQEKGRDAKRINDITNIQQVMKIIAEEDGSYLAACGGEFQGLVSGCQGEGDTFMLSKYLDNLASINDPAEKILACSSQCSETPCNYNFTKIAQDGYEVIFWLENSVSGYKKGCHHLTERGIE